MREKRVGTGIVQVLFNMLLLSILILCGFFSVITGAQVYENICRRADIAFEECTALSYMTNKVRQADEAGMIGVEQRQGRDVLCLKKLVSGQEYETLIYYMDHQVMEMFSRADSELELEQGLPVMDSRPIAFSRVGDSLLKVGLADGTSQVLLFPRSENQEEEGSDGQD